MTTQSDSERARRAEAHRKEAHILLGYGAWPGCRDAGCPIERADVCVRVADALEQADAERAYAQSQARHERERLESTTRELLAMEARLTEAQRPLVEHLQRMAPAPLHLTLDESSRVLSGMLKDRDDRLIRIRSALSTWRAAQGTDGRTHHEGCTHLDCAIERALDAKE